jgi:hypothetical protein
MSLGTTAGLKTRRYVVRGTPVRRPATTSERNGAATSSTSDVFRIIRRQVEVDLMEEPRGQR